MNWHWVDYAIIAVIAISALISVIRGFIREALSLITWGLASGLGFLFAKPLGHYFAATIPHPTLRLAIGFAIIFLGVLILGAIINSIISTLVKKTGLSSTDRLLGIIFGLARGFLVVVILLMLTKLTALDQQNWWYESALIKQFEPLESWLQQRLQRQLKTYLPASSNEDQPAPQGLFQGRQALNAPLPYQADESTP